MKWPIILLLCLAGTVHGQMEKRHLALYRLQAFLKRAPTIGASLGTFKLRDLTGKHRVLPLAARAGEKSRRPLVIIGGAYT